ncbi:MAG TPA: ABC transporter substrate-binding protein [Xanthobacteraceae bacterium]|jgi:NitT/TauT family transport system substrate-binding protein
MKRTSAAKPMPRGLSRRDFFRGASATAGAVAAASWPSRARSAAPLSIRYATGGGIGPNEMETLIWLDHLKSNVLKNYGKAYTLEMTFTRGSPEAAQLLAAGQVDLAALSSPAFAAATAKDAVPGGMSIISDIYQDGHPGNATNTFFVMKDSPIRSVADLKGKRVAINAYGSAVDLVLRVALKKAGLDARRDVQIVEVTFPNIAPALRESRIDCGVLVIPFLPVESAKGDLRALFTGGDTLGASSVVFQVATDKFIREHPEALRAFLEDFVQGLDWYYNPANREKALELAAGLTKSPKEVLASYFMTGRDYYRDRNGCVSVSAVQKPIDAMLEYKLLDRPVDAARYMKLQYLPKPCP